MDNIQAIIARNLSNLRKSRNLTLDQVSEFTGVSKAMLAQIEKGKSNPTVTTLWKIANGLQVSFSLFMKEDVPKVKKINIKELDPVSDNEGNYLVYSFFPYHPEKKFEIYIVELKPGCSHEAKSHLGEEYLLIKEGKLTVNLQGKEHVMESGDALQFTGMTPHSYINSTDELASFFLLMYYPEPEA
ncbi:helix-turn-helix domain-containing protein [Metabacillus arenae]|uniref:Helix-turn-helix transcriptional regulator n=1 Tax=Metabacillus arenae TaxID=2771434 RepID=A0A926NL75_9BACI|nr:XRE family transcriptional regulator [Metabacillus arenae]MBD1382013.1 helix-turn-helix transcriptional regulator [Metabacillus arenae]